MNTKEKLDAILEALMTIEVKGNNVIILSNCLQALNQVIQNLSNNSEE